MAVQTAKLEQPAQRTVATPWWERNLAWLLVAPMLLMFVVFALIPSITAVLFAFSHRPYLARIARKCRRLAPVADEDEGRPEEGV